MNFDGLTYSTTPFFGIIACHTTYTGNRALSLNPDPRQLWNVYSLFTRYYLFLAICVLEVFAGASAPTPPDGSIIPMPIISSISFKRSAVGISIAPQLPQTSIHLLFLNSGKNIPPQISPSSKSKCSWCINSPSLSLGHQAQSALNCHFSSSLLHTGYAGLYPLYCSLKVPRLATLLRSAHRSLYKHSPRTNAAL